MIHARSALTGAAVAILGTAAALTVPAADAGGSGSGGGAGHGGQGAPAGGRGPATAQLTLNEDTTGTLDELDADLDAINGAWTRRDSAGLIVVSLGLRSSKGSHHRGSASGQASSRSCQGGFLLATDDASTKWTAIRIDKRKGIVTAKIDGADPVTVFTLTKAEDGRAKGSSGGRGATVTVALTDAAADSLDAVLGSDQFTAGDVVGTLDAKGGKGAKGR